jgi:hypothetical protein
VIDFSVVVIDSITHHLDLVGLEIILFSQSRDLITDIVGITVLIVLIIVIVIVLQLV